MLISLLSSISLFTDNKRYKKPAHNPETPQRKSRTRAYFEEDEHGRRVHIDRGAAAREKKAIAERERVEAEFIAYERAKKARYENLTTVTDLNKLEF